MVGKNTNWQNYFQNLAGKRILYLQVRGNFLSNMQRK